MRERVVMAWLIGGLAACSEANPHLAFERQATTVAQAIEAGWSKGGAILVGDPNTFTFPQPLALRITIVDESDPEMPELLAISSATMESYGTGPFEIAIAPMCQDTLCTAELSLTGQGSSMVRVDASGPDGAERDCFYYALVDATVDAMMLREQLEAEQYDCRFE